jgi:hypothetical protein
MTDKANNTVRAEQIAESMKNGASQEQNAISDFVAGLLPKVTPAENSSSPQHSQGSDQRTPVPNGSDRANKIGDAIKNSGDGLLHKMQMQLVGPDEKGVIELKTGDTLVRAGGHEVLMLKGGGHVVVKPDGSYDIKTKDPTNVKYDAATGSTTIELGEGKSVTLRGGRISSVDGNGQTAVMLEEKKLDRLPRHELEPDWRYKLDHQNKSDK